MDETCSCVKKKENRTGRWNDDDGDDYGNNDTDDEGG